LPVVSEFGARDVKSRVVAEVGLAGLQALQSCNCAHMLLAAAGTIVPPVICLLRLLLSCNRHTPQTGSSYIFQLTANARKRATLARPLLIPSVKTASVPDVNAQAW
jgi:hypothetical protein